MPFSNKKSSSTIKSWFKTLAATIADLLFLVKLIHVTMGFSLRSLAGGEGGLDCNQTFTVPAQGLYNFKVLFVPK